MSTQTPDCEDFTALYRRAFAQYGTKALWNMRPVEDPSVLDALAITRALRMRVGMAGRRLAALKSLAKGDRIQVEGQLRSHEYDREIPVVGGGSTAIVPNPKLGNPRYSEIWYVGSAVAGQISFFVTAQPTVSLTNTSNSGLNNPETGADFVSGDGFSLAISSSSSTSGATVSVGTNGGPPNTVQGWVTNASGSLTVTGTETQPGDYEEIWYVAGLPVTPALDFTVATEPVSLTRISNPVVAHNPGNCPTNYAGVFGDIEYQLDSVSGAMNSFGFLMTPQETLVDADGVTIGPENIGPFPGFPDSSEYVAENGTFHDVPFGSCEVGAVLPYSEFLTTQTITVLIGSRPYSVRVNDWYVSSPGAGHGTATNDTDITIMR